MFSKLISGFKAFGSFIKGDSNTIVQVPERPEPLVSRKRKCEATLQQPEVEAFKRRRLVNVTMDNIDTEEDVTIVREPTSVERVKNWFWDIVSPSRPKKREKTEVIDLTKDEGKDTTQPARLTKEDLNADIQFLGHTRHTQTTQGSIPTRLEASPPTRLDGLEAEVHLLKVVNPNNSDAAVGFHEVLFTGFPGASLKTAILSSVQPQGPRSISKRLSILTKYEREVQRENNKPRNIATAMKAGSRQKSVISKILSPKSKYASGVKQFNDLQAKARYSTLLQQTPATRMFYRGISGYSFQSANLKTSTNKDIADGAKSSFFLPSDQKALQATLDLTPSVCRGKETLPSPLVPLTSKPLVSPFPSTVSKPLVQSTPLTKPEVGRKLSSLEEEHKSKAVSNDEFLKNLVQKYGPSKREIGKQILEEETRRKWLEENREKIPKELERRFQDLLSLRSTELEEEEIEDEEQDTELPDITPDMEEVIRNAFRARDSEQLVEAYKIPIAGKDIKTLKGLNWLNDEIINFYLQMIVARGGTEKYPRVYAFNTFFYTTYKDNGYNKIRRWTKKVDLFAQDIVLIPVHLGMHWCLATIDIQKKSINYYDSMGGDNKQCVELLKKYVQEEHEDKKKSGLDVSSWSSIIHKNIPQQMNGSDCGMFASKFAEYLSRRAKFSFSQANMEYFRRRMVYEIVKNTLMKP